MLRESSIITDEQDKFRWDKQDCCISLKGVVCLRVGPALRKLIVYQIQGLDKQFCSHCLSAMAMSEPHFVFTTEFVVHSNCNVSLLGLQLTLSLIR